MSDLERPTSQLLSLEQPFKVVSDFEPTGDQPKAIEELLEGEINLLVANGAMRSVGLDELCDGHHFIFLYFAERQMVQIHQNIVFFRKCDKLVLIFF